MKKRFALILALLMLASSLASCSESKENPETSHESDSPSNTPTESTGTDTETEEETEAKLELGLDPQTFGGYTFHIFTHSAIPNDFEAEEFKGEPINDAMYQRVVTVQDNSDCKIENILVNADNRQGHTNLGISVQAGTNDYDLACMSAYSSCDAMIAGYLLDMHKVPNLDLSQPWWDQYAVEDFTFRDACYMTTGDISIGDNKSTFCIYYNKRMATEYNLPDMYEMVDNKTWTIDNFRGLAETVDSDLDHDNDGSHVNDPDDIYGIYIWDDIMMGIVNASGLKCCTIDDNGNIQLTLYSEKFVDAFNKFTSYAYNKDVTCAYQRNGYDIDYGIVAFRDGRALFFMDNLGTATEYREMEDDFGILPLPLYDENQDRYYNSAASWALSLYSIPKNSFNEEELARTGYITQALAYESLYTLTPAYYSQTLQSKVSRDENSARMLDLIFSTRTYDFGWYFEIGSYNEAIMNQLRSYSSDVTSMYNKTERLAKKVLEKYNEQIAELVSEQ